MYWEIEKDSSWKIICAICWKSFNKLWLHIYYKHNMTTDNYREKFWLDQCSRLMSESSISLARKRNKENYELVVKENLIKWWKKTRYNIWHKWRTKDKLIQQTIIRLSNNKFKNVRKKIS